MLFLVLIKARDEHRGPWRNWTISVAYQQYVLLRVWSRKKLKKKVIEKMSDIRGTEGGGGEENNASLWGCLIGAMGVHMDKLLMFNVETRYRTEHQYRPQRWYDSFICILCFQQCRVREHVGGRHPIL